MLSQSILDEKIRAECSERSAFLWRSRTNSTLGNWPDGICQLRHQVCVVCFSWCFNNTKERPIGPSRVVVTGVECLCCAVLEAMQHHQQSIASNTLLFAGPFRNLQANLGDQWIQLRGDTRLLGIGLFQVLQPDTHVSQCLHQDGKVVCFVKLFQFIHASTTRLVSSFVSDS